MSFEVEKTSTTPNQRLSPNVPEVLCLYFKEFSCLQLLALHSPVTAVASCFATIISGNTVEN